MNPLFLILILLNMSDSYAQTDTLNRKDELGRKQGHWIYYGSDRPESCVPPEGKVEEGDYLNDRKEGMWIKYHQDGITPKLIGEYENNRPKGNYTKFYPNGQLKEVGNFLANHYIDSLIRYYENGQREYASWSDSTGKIQWEAYWHPDGSPGMNIFEYDTKGVSASGTHTTYLSKRLPILTDPGPEPNTQDEKWNRNGYNKVYSESNKLIMEGKFKHGLLWDGKLYYYDYTGSIFAVYLIGHGRFMKELD